MLNRNQEYQRYLVLNLIYRFGPISRTELTDMMNCRPGTVGEITRELLEEQLIVESGRLSTGHGRRRAMLELNKEFICSIGVSIARGSATTLITQMDGSILHRTEDNVRPDMRKEELSARIYERVQDILERYGDRKIVGIGISDPLYDPALYSLTSTLVSNYEHFNDWVHFDLKPRLEALSGLSVETFSPVAFPALVEMRFGVAQGVRDFISVELSNGIGASLCVNGSPVEGSSGVAGELGHTVVDMSGNGDSLCYCGKRGCVETATAFPALVQEIRSALGRGVQSMLRDLPNAPDQLSLADIRRALQEGDAMCRFCVSRVAARIGVAIANLVNLLNPELVVLHGFMLELGDYFIEEVSRAIRKNVLVLAKSFDIRISSSLTSMIPLGAATEMFTSFLRVDDYNWVYRLAPDTWSVGAAGK